MIRRPAVRAALCVAALFAAVAPASASAVVLNETGSTLLYPLFQRWVAAYAEIQPDVKITIAATGSGDGYQVGDRRNRADRHLGRLHVR